jgi:sugar phosphate isomerase/epimerase
MTKRQTPIYLASVLLEPNRWKPKKLPSFAVSEWSARAAAAGFDGWELWENHYLHAKKNEQHALREGPLPVTVFNTYASFASEGADARRSALEATATLAARSIKFNVGNDPARMADYRTVVAATAAATSARLWCECHPGTQLEDPERAAQFFNTWPESDVPCDAIVHPFLLSPEAIARWHWHLGSRLRHAHVQMRAKNDSRRFLALADDAPRVRECLAALRESGYTGSFTIEFTAPTGTANDRPPELFDAARRDLEFLREHWGE